MKTLLLDVMGTLVHDPFYEEMPRWFGLSLDELLAQKDPHAWVDFEFGAIDQEAFSERFFADRRPIDGEGLRRKARESFRLLDGIEELLQELKERGVPMHAFSNYPIWWQDVEQATGLSRWLRWSFVSCDLGLRKPDPKAYREVLRRLGTEAPECVFVDDQERNVLAARELGMIGLHFEGVDRLQGQLLATHFPAPDKGAPLS